MEVGEYLNVVLEISANDQDIMWPDIRCGLRFASLGSKDQLSASRISNLVLMVKDCLNAQLFAKDLKKAWLFLVSPLALPNVDVDSETCRIYPQTRTTR